jgi:hypothetical protein
MGVFKGKGKVRPTRDHEGPEGEQKYSSTLSLTLALDGDGWLKPHPSCFTAGIETWYPLCRRMGEPQGRSGHVQKTSPPPEFDSPDRPVHSKLLYQLHYPDPTWEYLLIQNLIFAIMLITYFFSLPLLCPMCTVNILFTSSFTKL